ncbi:hypothetical protein PHMEG_00016089 [Phytophthora megakarya]|uniref:Uncharacterized protein n=1 Tax=Phytophthora megakarya TaxID=4795 RepID=A0A225VZT6_9STRA|nr:hypothetical protein PHMEG_00016089 [Phytophthora megakarya]
MKLLFQRSASLMAARHMSSLREQAVRVMAGKIRADLETNPNVWLSASAVDEPTVSILDPAPGYALAGVDFDKPMSDVDVPLAYLPTDPSQLADPFTLVEQDMVGVTTSIKHILGSDHPVLAAVARYFFEHDGGKKVRPTMVLLMARAAEAHRHAVGLPLPETQSDEYTHAAQQRLAEITCV